MKRAAFLAGMGLFLAAAPVGMRAADAPPPDGAPAKADEVGTVAGTAIARDKGGWIGVEIKGSNFVLTFYNEKKKPTPADVSSAVLWWPVHYQPNAERVELVPGDDPAVFSSPRVIRPPYSFKLHITLLNGAKQDDVESYVVDFSN